jgi:hypothetical protein
VVDVIIQSPINKMYEWTDLYGAGAESLIVNIVESGDMFGVVPQAFYRGSNLPCDGDE